MSWRTEICKSDVGFTPGRHIIFDSQQRYRVYLVFCSEIIIDYTFGFIDLKV